MAAASLQFGNTVSPRAVGWVQVGLLGLLGLLFVRRFALLL